MNLIPDDSLGVYLACLIFVPGLKPFHHCRACWDPTQVQSYRKGDKTKGSPMRADIRLERRGFWQRTEDSQGWRKSTKYNISN